MGQKEKIRSFIEANLIVIDDDIDFTDSDNIFQMGYVNSMFAMQLLGFVEREFHITLSNDDINIRNFSSVDNIMVLIDRLKVGA